MEHAIHAHLDVLNVPLLLSVVSVMTSIFSQERLANQLILLHSLDFITIDFAELWKNATQPARPVMGHFTQAVFLATIHYRIM
jgi:hypothetical protein